MNLRELSETLGLSQTTVSRALNGYPEVREETRRRVREAAEQFGYRPNTRALSLATGRAMAIGHVIPLNNQHQMSNVLFADFIAGAGRTYAQEGYEMRISFVEEEAQTEAFATLARNRSVDGLIVHGPKRKDPRIAALKELELPFLVHGRSSDVVEPYGWLDVGSFQAMQQATDYLTQLGHRRIGFLNGPEVMDFAWRRRQGYLEALRVAGIEEDPALMRAGEMSEPLGFNSTQEMLALPAPPTAFLASSFVIALGVRRAIETAGLTMGRDVSVMCFDDCISYLPNGTQEPIFTAMRSSISAAGSRIGELLIAQIRDKTLPQPNELWPAELVIGPSTGPYNGAEK